MNKSNNQAVSATARSIWDAMFLGFILIAAYQSADAEPRLNYRSIPDAFICYWQTTDGRVLNLNRLCQSSNTPQVVVRGITYNGNVATGEVVNLSRKTIYRLRVSYAVKVKNQVTEQTSIDTDPSILVPGQTAVFMAVLPAGGQIADSLPTWSEQR